MGWISKLHAPCLLRWTREVSLSSNKWTARFDGSIIKIFQSCSRFLGRNGRRKLVYQLLNSICSPRTLITCNNSNLYVVRLTAWGTSIMPSRLRITMAPRECHFSWERLWLNELGYVTAVPWLGVSDVGKRTETTWWSYLRRRQEWDVPWHVSLQGSWSEIRLTTKTGTWSRTMRGSLVPAMAWHQPVETVYHPTMSALWKLFFSRAATFDNGGTVATFPLLNETHMGHFSFDMFGKGAIAVVEKIAWHYLLRMSQLERVKRLAHHFRGKSAIFRAENERL